MTDDYTTAEIVRTLKRVETKIDSLGNQYVPRGEFQEWQKGIGREIREVKADIDKLESDLGGRKVPWTAAGALAVSALTFIVLLIQIIPGVAV